MTFYTADGLRHLTPGSEFPGKPVSQEFAKQAAKNVILNLMFPYRTSRDRPGSSSQRNTPLTEAVLRSDYASMHQLILSGADPNEFDEYRMTPLLWAVMRGDINAVRFLLENGADPNVRPNPSDSPLWSAEDDWGFHDIAALLKSYGAVK